MKILLNRLQRKAKYCLSLPFFWIFILITCWLLTIMIVGWVRPLFPSNELRYISVAWEMWVHQSFIVPLQGVQPYPHKPPLLFWLVHMGWLIFGVNSWWPRLLPGLFGLGSLCWVYWIARYLWPEQILIARLAPLLLMGMIGWLSQLNLFKFDMMVAFFVLFSLYCLVKATRERGRWYLFLAIAIALSILTKGPVCLLFILPPILLMPYWLTTAVKSVHSMKTEYYGMAAAIMLALLLVLFWALPAAWLGGHQYTQAIFWHQSVGRVAGEFGGVKQSYAYFEFLLWLLFPWSVWLTLWRGFWQIFFKTCSNQKVPDEGLRFLGVVIVAALVCLSLIPVKSERYIIPLLPWFALLFAYIMVNAASKIRWYDQLPIAIIYVSIGILYLLLPHFAPIQLQQRIDWLHELLPIWGFMWVGLGVLLALVRAEKQEMILIMTLTSVVAFSIYNLGWVKQVAKYNDLQPMAKQLAHLERNHAPIALYQSDFEFEFLGRLRNSSTLIDNPQSLMPWVRRHPRGWIVSVDTSVYPKRFILKPASDYLKNNQ